MVRAERARRSSRGCKLYPEAKCELDYSNAHELLFATILSAQCTDARVNRVTKTLFQRYRTVADYANADPPTLEAIIHSCGFYRSKARSIRRRPRPSSSGSGRFPPRWSSFDSARRGAQDRHVVLGDAFGKGRGSRRRHHMKRLAYRMGLTDETDPAAVERDLMACVSKKDWRYFSHAMIWHGRRVCTPPAPPARDAPCVRIAPSGAWTPTNGRSRRGAQGPETHEVVAEVEIVRPRGHQAHHEVGLADMRDDGHVVMDFDRRRGTLFGGQAPRLDDLEGPRQAGGHAQGPHGRVRARDGRVRGAHRVHGALEGLEAGAVPVRQTHRQHGPDPARGFVGPEDADHGARGAFLFIRAPADARQVGEKEARGGGEDLPARLGLRARPLGTAASARRSADWSQSPRAPQIWQDEDEEASSCAHGSLWPCSRRVRSARDARDEESRLGRLLAPDVRGDRRQRHQRRRARVGFLSDAGQRPCVWRRAGRVHQRLDRPHAGRACVPPGQGPPGPSSAGPHARTEALARGRRGGVGARPRRGPRTEQEVFVLVGPLQPAAQLRAAVAVEEGVLSESSLTREEKSGARCAPASRPRRPRPPGLRARGRGGCSRSSPAAPAPNTDRGRSRREDLVAPHPRSPFPRQPRPGAGRRAPARHPNSA